MRAAETKSGDSAEGKVIGPGDAVLEMIERAVQRKPVKIFRRSLDRAIHIEGANPAVKGLVGSQAAVSALPQVAVRGNKAGDDPVSSGIPHCFRLKTGRRVTR